MAGLEGLSEHDKKVLRSIFDPTATIADVEVNEDTFEEQDDEATTDAEKQSVQLCARGVHLANEGKLEEALEVLNRGVEAAPERAAGYNDRAQLLRLIKKDDEAMADLDRAIHLTTGRKTKARALALCQRGVLLRKRGDDARATFLEAAKLGSGFAKKQCYAPKRTCLFFNKHVRFGSFGKHVVELNPYAALCNQMLSEVMRGGAVKLDNIPEPDKIQSTSTFEKIPYNHTNGGILRAIQIDPLSSEMTILHFENDKCYYKSKYR